MSDVQIVDLVELRKVYALLKDFVEKEEVQRRKVYARHVGTERQRYWGQKLDEVQGAKQRLAMLGKVIAGVQSGKVRLVDSADPAASEMDAGYVQTPMFDDIPSGADRKKLGFD